MVGGERITVVDRTPSDANRIYFGATVDIEFEDGETATYRLVGPDEFDAEPHFISIDSPMARALLKKEVGDEAELRDRSFEVISISYES